MKRYRYVDLVTEEGVELYIEEWVEIKKTPRGAWVQLFYMGHSIGKKRFVLDGYGRRLCHQTKEQAWESFKLRKKWQASRAQASFDRAKYTIEQIANFDKAPQDNLVLGKPDFWHSYVFE
jgi:hypothetical protein